MDGITTQEKTQSRIYRMRWLTLVVASGHCHVSRAAGCWARRRSESVPSEVFGQRKCPCQLFRGSVTETGQLQVGEWVSEDGYWPDLGFSDSSGAWEAAFSRLRLSL